MPDSKPYDLLIVDDDGEFRKSVVQRFSRRGHNIQDAGTGEEALAKADRRQFDVAVIDMMMPGMSGMELLERLRAQNPESEVIMLTGQGSVESAVRAMKLGAFDYLTKPFPLTDLESLIEKAHERRLLRKENQQLQAVLGRTQSDALDMVGASKVMQELFRLIQRAGPTDKAILIQGGKRHGQGARSQSSPSVQLTGR